MILWILLCQHSKNWLNISNFMSKKPYNIFWAFDLYINVIQFVKIRVTVHVIYTEHFSPREGHNKSLNSLFQSTDKTLQKLQIH